MPSPSQPANESEAQRINRSLAEAAAEAEEIQADETDPGGQYMVGGQLVDAEGKPVEEKDSEKDDDEEETTPATPKPSAEPTRTPEPTPSASRSSGTNR